MSVVGGVRSNRATVRDLPHHAGMADIDADPTMAAEAAAMVARAAAAGRAEITSARPENRPAWADELIRQFQYVESRQGCPHVSDAREVAIWLAIAPDLLSCTACLDELVTRIEARLSHPLDEERGRCTACGRQAYVRGVSVTLGRFILRGILCSDCLSGEESRTADPADDAHEATLQSLVALGIPPVRIDFEALDAAEDREPFDELAWEMLARAGRLAERLVEAVGRQDGGQRVGLDLDQAVIGGLLVRAAKLTKSIFDATQTDSEAHSPLSRCLAETTITLRWLLAEDSAESYRRFRADSFASWHFVRVEERAIEDDTARALHENVMAHFDAELAAAGLSWDDVPARSNSWGPSTRQRFQALGQGSLYDTLFAGHSNYVHPTWHEIRAFHLRPCQGGGMRLDLETAGMVPVAAYVLARLVVEACLDTASALPHDLPMDALSDVVTRTVGAAEELGRAFASFAARGGIADDLWRHHGASIWDRST